MTRLEIQDDMGKLKPPKQNGHILFYRALGFCPSNPMHLPLEQMVPSELVTKLREPITTLNTKSLATSCIEFIGECCEEIDWSKDRKASSTDEDQCCSYFVEGSNLLVKCGITNCGLQMCIMCYSQFSIKKRE